jgi:hypothetical protein
VWRLNWNVSNVDDNAIELFKKARVALACLPAIGCYAFGEAGYTNTVRTDGIGDVAAVARVGLGDLRSETTHVLPEAALRADLGTVGDRGEVGIDVAYALRLGWRTALTPILRGGVWLAPLRGGDARADDLAIPAIDFGVLGLSGNGTNQRSAWVVGLRGEWLGRAGGALDAVGWTLYLGYGTSRSISIPE